MASSVNPETLRQVLTDKQPSRRAKVPDTAIAIERLVAAIDQGDQEAARNLAVQARTFFDESIGSGTVRNDRESNVALVGTLLQLGVDPARLEPLAVGLEELARQRGPDPHAFHELARGVLRWSTDEKSGAAEMAGRCGLAFKHTLWQDLERSAGILGENSSDLGTLVEIKDAVRGQVYTQRAVALGAPNYPDMAGRVDMANFQIRVGNEVPGGPLKTISFREYLERGWEHMTNPSKWPVKDDEGRNVGLYVPGVDEQAIFSSQNMVIPLPNDASSVDTYPTIFNYGSETGYPKVITILIVPEGTSMGVPGSSTTRLFFNKGGKNAPIRVEAAAESELEGAGVLAQSAAEAQRNAGLRDRMIVAQVPVIPKPKPEAPPPDDGMEALLRSYISGSGSSSAAWRGGDVGTFDTLRSFEPMAVRSALPRFSSPPIRQLQTAALGVGKGDGTAFNEDMGHIQGRDPRQMCRFTFFSTSTTGETSLTEAQLHDAAMKVIRPMQNLTDLRERVAPPEPETAADAGAEVPAEKQTGIV